MRLPPTTTVIISEDLTMPYNIVKYPFSPKLRQLSLSNKVRYKPSPEHSSALIARLPRRPKINVYFILVFSRPALMVRKEKLTRIKFRLSKNFFCERSFGGLGFLQKFILKCQKASQVKQIQVKSSQVKLSLQRYFWI